MARSYLCILSVGFSKIRSFHVIDKKSLNTEVCTRSKTIRFSKKKYIKRENTARFAPKKGPVQWVSLYFLRNSYGNTIMLFPTTINYHHSPFSHNPISIYMEAQTLYVCHVINQLTYITPSRVCSRLVESCDEYTWLLLLHSTIQAPNGDHSKSTINERKKQNEGKLKISGLKINRYVMFILLCC